MFGDSTINMETFEFQLITKNIEDIVKERNIFKNPYESFGMKIGATLAYLIGFPVVYVLIEFINKELEDQNKTIFNLLLACNYGILIFFLPICAGVDLIIVWFGPLPTLICQMQNIAKGSFTMVFFVTLYSIFVLRFLFVVVWSKMKIINDYLLAAIIIRTSLFLGKHFLRKN